VLYVVAMGLVAGVTVVLNLDTSVAFLTPVLVGAARRRGASEERCCTAVSSSPTRRRYCCPAAT
jgi:Na+/H+ antiporter NhaD/arsenite permease-like protein